MHHLNDASSDENVLNDASSDGNTYTAEEDADREANIRQWWTTRDNCD